MILLKPHVWKKPGSRVKCRNNLSHSDCRIFKLEHVLNYWRYKVDFLNVGTYLLKLQIDDVVLHEWGQVCPGMPKEAVENLRSQKLKDVYS